LNGVIVGGDYKKERDASDNAAVTRDGGATWTLVPPPGLGGFRSGVAHVTGKAGPMFLAVGPSGSDLSESGGRSWRPIESTGFHAVSLAHGTGTGWGVGESGTIARVDWPSVR
jgi:hypothetical protein